MIRRKKPESGREIPISFVSRKDAEKQAQAEEQLAVSEADRARLLDE